MEEALYLILAMACGSQAVACVVMACMFRHEPVIGLVICFVGTALTGGTITMLKFGGVF